LKGIDLALEAHTPVLLSLTIKAGECNLLQSQIPFMKLILVASTTLLAVNTFAAGSEAIIRQRAKDLSNQNNVRQGVPPPVQAPPNTAQTAPPAVAMTPMGKLQTDLAAIKLNSPATPAQKQQLARDLMALAQGPKKPSSGAANKLAEDMSAALSQKALSEGVRSRLVQDLNGALNPGNLQPTQMQDILSDVQAVFQTAGVSRKEAVAIGDDVKAIAGELQKSAK
jgi:hypothetical protein